MKDPRSNIPGKGRNTRDGRDSSSKAEKPPANKNMKVDPSRRVSHKSQARRESKGI
jgi:hypothetical protein